MNSYNKNIYSKNFIKKENEIWINKKFETNQNNIYGCFDLEWEKIDNALSYVILVCDYGATNVIGQNFIHWVVANIKDNRIKENSNWEFKYPVIEGYNSTCPHFKNEGVLIECIPKGFKSKSLKQAIGFFPPMPPDKKHLYQIRIYGIDLDEITLRNGFFIGELFEIINNHIVGIHYMNFWYYDN